MARKAATKRPNFTTNLSFEGKLWLAADKLRNNMDAAEYEHVALGLIFDEYRAKLLADQGDYPEANGETLDKYRDKNVFLMPTSATSLN